MAETSVDFRIETRIMNIDLHSLVKMVYHKGLAKPAANYVLLHKYFLYGSHKTARRRTYYL